MVFETFENICYMHYAQVKGPLSFLCFFNHTCYRSCTQYSISDIDGSWHFVACT